MLSRLKNLFGRKSQGVGLEITPDRLNLIQLTKQGHNYKISQLTSSSLPEGIFEEGRIADPEALATSIQDLLFENKIQARRVATAVPMRESLIRLIPLPAELNDEELRAQIEQEVSWCLPYPREEVDLDYQKLGSFQDEDGIEKVQILLVATRKEVTDSYLQTFQQAGLEVDVLDINSFALIRTIREQLRQFGSREATVLVDIEFDSTDIAIIVDGIPQFSRTVPIGTFQMQAALCRGMNLPPSRNTEDLQGMTIPATQFDSLSTQGTAMNPGMASLMRILGELLDELRRSINYYLNENKGLDVVQIFLAGPGGGLMQLDDYFTQRLGVPTVRIDPVTALTLETDRDIPLPQRSGLGTVMGLGLREV